MMETSCPEGSTGTVSPTFSRDEVTALFLNLLLFEGDWDEHLRFLEERKNEDPSSADMIAVVMELREKDRELNIQSWIRAMDEG